MSDVFMNTLFSDVFMNTLFSDVFMNTLFSDVFKSMGMTLDGSANTGEYELVFDDEYPVLMSYDSKAERVLLISMVDIETVPPAMQGRFFKRSAEPYPQ
ncbi:type III secretion system chaperone family protein [Marinomonas mediterranea]|uniref:type III secretion system chaperone n=1 Tax=Marinomonas mediterranea TaxID=119864 RepID=UPI0005A2A6A2|nr:type III secretion system chaperone [Marinomonas mediterranea]WCN17705.1 hypothetical protein GV053_11940 [Marinomonas mediterranea MMB-1]